jgi:predicted AAA+ superfamily ATPase
MTDLLLLWGHILTGSRYFVDEFQNVPEMLSYIKIITDRENIPAQFVLTGSNQFEFMPHINQSLAGRTALLKLLPLTLKEMYADREVNIWSAIQRGFYPALLNADYESNIYYKSYIGTYLERDIRSLSLVRDLSVFRLFMSLLAGRTGTELNKNKLANDVGVDIKTISHWLSLLETSNVIHFLRPWHQNWKKRIVKSPKLYFTDTGLVCHLLGIHDGLTLQNHPLRSEIFETFVICETLKHYMNRGISAPLYYLRAKDGFEIDLIIDLGVRQILAEIKSGATIHSSWFESLAKAKTEFSDTVDTYLIYNGTDTYNVKDTGVIPVRQLEEKLFPCSTE